MPTLCTDVRSVSNTTSGGTLLRGSPRSLCRALWGRDRTASKRLSGIRTSLREPSHSIAGPSCLLTRCSPGARPDSTLFPLKHDVAKGRHLQLHIHETGDTRHSNMMTGFTVLPLQIASYVGFTFTLFGVGVLVFVLARTSCKALPWRAFLSWLP